MKAYCIRDSVTGDIYLPHNMIMFPTRKQAELVLKYFFSSEKTRKLKEIIRVEIKEDV